MDKVIYLAAGYAKLQEPGITYNDLIIPRENRQDMLSVDLSDYGILIATPPCNFYSYARGSRRPSDYALNTAHLLLEVIIKFYLTSKPFIVENVTNKTTLNFIWAMCADLGLYRFKHARHTYITNFKFDFSSVKEEFDFSKGGYFINKWSDRQGGNQVNAVFDLFIRAVRTSRAAQPGQAAQPGKAAKSIEAARLELSNRLKIVGAAVG
jgi:hypothetical protein